MMTHARVTSPKGRTPRARVSHINQTDRHRLLIILAQVQGNNRQSKNAMNVILSCRVQNLRHVQYKSIMSFWECARGGGAFPPLVLGVGGLHQTTAEKCKLKKVDSGGWLSRT